MLEHLGGAGAGAAEGLQDFLLQQIREQQMQEQMRAAQAQELQRQRELEQRGREHQDELGLRTRQLDQADTARRDQSNRAGVKDMLDQRSIMDADEDNRALDEMSATMPPAVRQIVGLRRRGVSGVNAQDLETPEQRATRLKEDEDNDVRRAGRMADAQAAAAARYRKPDDPAAPPKSTEGERKSAGLMGEARQAAVALEAIESQLSERDLYQIQSLPQEGILGGLNRSQMSDTAKRYIHALDQFTEALLRSKSGATITPAEILQGRRTYGRQYGETPQLGEQRKAARAAGINTLETMAGTAGRPTFNGQPVDAPSLRKPIPGIPGAEAESTDGGKTWKRVK